MIVIIVVAMRTKMINGISNDDYDNRENDNDYKSYTDDNKGNSNHNYSKNKDNNAN